MKKNKKLSKEEVIGVRCTAPQKESLETAAAREGLGVSTWLLRLGLVAVEQLEAERKKR